MAIWYSLASLLIYVKQLYSDCDCLKLACGVLMGF